MSSILERRAVALGGLLVGEGPAVVIGGRVSLRAGGGQALGDLGEQATRERATGGQALGERAAGGQALGERSTRERAAGGRATLMEPSSAADLPLIAERADAVVVGASWTRDIPLVRAAAALGLPVVVERRATAPVEEWLMLADYCATEGDGRVLLCESGGRPDLGLLRAARAASGRPVLADVSGDPGLSAAAVAAGADGLIVGDTGLREAEEAVTVVGALLRHERPESLPELRQAIDRVDAALATLLERRAALAGTVQRTKPVGGFAGRDLVRERALVARMALRAPSLGEARLASIMNAVIEAGLHLAEERGVRGS